MYKYANICICMHNLRIIAWLTCFQFNSSRPIWGFLYGLDSMKLHRIHIAKLIFACIVFDMLFPAYTSATPSHYQQCASGDTCVVGEFVFDDTYAPVSDAQCTLKSRYPDGTIFVNTQPMTPGSDGWYGYDIVASGSAGLYRTQVCCTTNGEYMCLDKNFEVTTASSSGSLTSDAIANAVWDASRTDHTTSGSFGQALQNIVPSSSEIAIAVWGYSSRTLSSFGTLISDIWSYSTRSITTFGSLASDIWSNSTRTLTGVDISSGSIATKSDVESVKNDVSKIIATTSGSLALNEEKLNKISKVTQENRLLLEQVVNKPIIKNFLEEDTTPDLQAKLDQTKNITTQMYIVTSRIGGKMGLVQLKWNQLTNSELNTAINEFSTLTGDEKVSTSLLGGLASLKNSWNMALLEDMYVQATTMKTRLASLKEEVHIYGKSKMAYDDFQQLRVSFSNIERNLGTTTDTEKKSTFFGRIDHIRQLASSFDKNTTEINKLLASWTTFTPSILRDKAQTLAKNIIPLNMIPQAVISLDGVTTDKQLKNKVLGMRGIIDTNKKLLARTTEKPLINMWLEEGSVIFKSIITNPSTLISQTVPMKYYLPKEVNKESIIHVDDGLEVAYDSEKAQFFVTGNFILAAEETKTLSVTVDESVFTIQDEQIASLRKQAEQLAEPLKKTSFFAQSVTLKSDIDVAMNKVIQLQKNAVTPEGRIRAYREAKIEFEGAQVKVEKLKDLVTQAGSAGSLMGFVGGAQVLAVWGLIIILITGFVSLVIYMRVLRVNPKEIVRDAVKQPVEKKEIDTDTDTGPDAIIEQKKEHKKHISKHALRYAMILLTFGTLTSSVTGVGVYIVMHASAARSGTLASLPESHHASSNVPVQVLGTQTQATVSAELNNTQQSSSLSAVDVASQLDGQEEKIITVIDNPAGFLRVRKTPGGIEVAKLSPGDVLHFIQEKNGWSQIRMEDGSLGWVSSRYVK